MTRRLSRSVSCLIMRAAVAIRNSRTWSCPKPGSKGADAVANILFGDVNPSAKLPLTFPRSEADLPHPSIAKPQPGAPRGKPSFEVRYDEGVKVGYKWFDAENKPVLFPFGYGLSYTTFAYSNLKVNCGDQTVVSFTLKNTGRHAGAEVAQVYASLPPGSGEPPKRLVAFTKIQLDPGESRKVKLTIDSKYLSIFDISQNHWKLLPGVYTFLAGGSSQDLPLQTKTTLP